MTVGFSLSSEKLQAVFLVLVSHTGPCFVSCPLGSFSLFSFSCSSSTVFQWTVATETVYLSMFLTPHHTMTVKILVHKPCFKGNSLFSSDSSRAESERPTT
uniref:Uncharacterized protein n=1 Tax=Mus musculus TaxID=10090 RepID=Q8CB38_MOUSE|nr:unnamed protein product [Mus musculus]